MKNIICFMTIMLLSGCNLSHKNGHNSPANVFDTDTSAFDNVFCSKRLQDSLDAFILYASKDTRYDTLAFSIIAQSGDIFNPENLFKDTLIVFCLSYKLIRNEDPDAPERTTAVGAVKVSNQVLGLSYIDFGDGMGKIFNKQKFSRTLYDRYLADKYDETPRLIKYYKEYKLVGRDSLILVRERGSIETQR